MSKRRPKDLKWGETPFDRMTPEDVLLSAKRMYSALGSLLSVAMMMRNYEPASPYWTGGVGGAAIEKGTQAMAAVSPQDDKRREQIYRMFYRYADDLLFDISKHPMIGNGWVVCPVDGEMSAPAPGYPSRSECFKCRGPMRPLTWDDMAPITADQE